MGNVAAYDRGRKPARNDWHRIQPRRAAAAGARDGQHREDMGYGAADRIDDVVQYSPGSGQRVSIKALAFSPDETRVYAVTDDVGVYEFPWPLDDVIRDAKSRVRDASLSDDDCLKYLHQQACPAQIHRRP